VVYGALEKESLRSILDLNGREKLMLYPLVALVLLFGVYPVPVFDVTQVSVDALIENYQNALEAAKIAAASH
jgi:NADH-quinone oxidoreductase subunit M